METIRIPNLATESPIALSDVIVAAPLASRLLLGVSPVGRILQTAAIGWYAGSALVDWVERRGVRKIDFMTEFGADVEHLEEMSSAERESEATALAGKLHDGLTMEKRPREKVAREVDRHLTAYIASLTGQRVETSTNVRGFGLASLMMPFAVGACDILTGDVAIYRDMGYLEPHLIAHEFVHRKGYWKELHAQALAYLSLAGSGDPLLVQSARLERLHRQLKVLSAEGPEDSMGERYQASVSELDLPEELFKALEKLKPADAGVQSGWSRAMRTVYDERMKLTGQNGISDYDEGFTNFLYTFERSRSARQSGERAAV